LVRDRVDTLFAPRQQVHLGGYCIEVVGCTLVPPGEVWFVQDRRME
jgi:hypothetical protein